jgi:hypothetical protein
MIRIRFFAIAVLATAFVTAPLAAQPYRRCRCRHRPRARPPPAAEGPSRPRVT